MSCDKLRMGVSLGNISLHIKTFSIVKCIWKECQILHFTSKSRTGVGNFELCYKAQSLHFASKRHNNELRVGILNTTRCGASRSDHPFKSYRTVSAITLVFLGANTGWKSMLWNFGPIDSSQTLCNTRSLCPKSISIIILVSYRPFLNCPPLGVCSFAAVLAFFLFQNFCPTESYQTF